MSQNTQFLRQQLKLQRQAFMASRAGVLAHQNVASHLNNLLHTLEPDSLGIYWPLPGEFNAPIEGQLSPQFNAAEPWAALQNAIVARLALPFAKKTPPVMHYRAWSGKCPVLKDECGIATCSGELMVPDVLLVPCLGYSLEGFRLGYGGGYFDRYLSNHPHVTTIGMAWSIGQLSALQWQPYAHDQPLTLILTEQGVVRACP
jgi:5-formyltetrahydrofolate cyclo-ligase